MDRPLWTVPFSSPAQTNLDLPSLTFPAAEAAFQATAKSLDETATLLPLSTTTGSTHLENVFIGQNADCHGNGNPNQPPNKVGMDSDAFGLVQIVSIADQ